MPSRTDTAGYTKAFIHPAMDHWGGGLWLTIYAISDQVESTEVTCENGATLEPTGGCVCPPGYTGPTCGSLLNG